jgi:hypothetical protein
MPEFRNVSMAQRICLACIVTGFVWVALAADDPKQDPDDNEGRSRVLSAVQVPIRQLDGYQKWPMLTPGPVDVSEGLFYSCRNGGPDGRKWKELRDEQGLHWLPAIRVYANPAAKRAIDGKKPTFPPGSVLVKEKLSNNKVVAITAMIRERDGYDRSDEKNDWRYFYIDRSEEMQFGRIESCRKCHQKAAETDFAFLKYSNHPGYSSGP